jgi:prepilin-type N-terminal cleavage/methylation domain-containing protein
MARRRTNGFTLVELLTVVVIAGVLIGLTIPAVTRLMSSGGVSAASREVANTLGLARQYAITRRVYARVVFPYSATVSQPDMQYRTYAVMTNRDNTVATGWAYLTKWEYLPLGVVFLNRNLPSPLPQLPRGALDDPNSLSQNNLPFPNSGPGGPLLAYIEFGPTGAATALSSGSGGGTLAITEGFTSVIAGVETPQPTSKSSTNTLVNVTTIGVDALVGHIQVTR